METTASILVNGIKQRFYFNDTVYLKGNTEFEIEFFNKSKRTVCPSLTINGEELTSSPVIYNGQKFVLKDFISDTRKLLFHVYEVDSNDEEVKQAIKENGIISIKYFYEKLQVKKDCIKCSESKLDLEDDTLSSDNIPPRTDDLTDIDFFLPEADYDMPMADYDMPIADKVDINLKEETGKITKGAPSGMKYEDVKIELDYTDYETQIIKLLPLSKKPQYQVCIKCQNKSKIDANYCEDCGKKY